MAHFVSSACVKCKYTDCAVVCPVSCFHEGDLMVVIDPDICIDCGVCVNECPVGAIYHDAQIDDLTVPLRERSNIESDDKAPNAKTPNALDWLRFNKHFSKEWPKINAQKPPHPDHQVMGQEKQKWHLLPETEQKVLHDT